MPRTSGSSSCGCAIGPPTPASPYERDHGRFRAVIGPRGLRTVGLGDLSDFAATLTGSPATRRRTLSAIKALLTTGFKMGALRFNVGAALRLPKVVSRRAEGSLEEIEVFRLLTALDGQPRDRVIVEALYGTERASRSSCSCGAASSIRAVRRWSAAPLSPRARRRERTAPRNQSARGCRRRRVRSKSRRRTLRRRDQMRALVLRASSRRKCRPALSQDRRRPGPRRLVRDK